MKYQLLFQNDIHDLILLKKIKFQADAIKKAPTESGFLPALL